MGSRSGRCVWYARLVRLSFAAPSTRSRRRAQDIRALSYLARPRDAPYTAPFALRPSRDSTRRAHRGCRERAVQASHFGDAPGLDYVGS